MDYSEVIEFVSEIPDLFRSKFGNLISEEKYAELADLSNSRFFSKEAGFLGRMKAAGC